MSKARKYFVLSVQILLILYVLDVVKERYLIDSEEPSASSGSKQRNSKSSRYRRERASAKVEEQNIYEPDLLDDLGKHQQELPKWDYPSGFVAEPEVNVKQHKKRVLEDVDNNADLSERLEEYKKEYQREAKAYEKKQSKTAKDIPSEDNVAPKTSKHDYDIACNVEIVETVPYVLKKKGLAKPMDVEHMSIHEGWFKLIDKAKKEFAIVSQWGIGKRGKGADFYNYLLNAVVNRSIHLDVVHTYKFKKGSGHAPFDIKKAAPTKVRTKQPSIEGKTSPGYNYGIIHSKILAADRAHFYMGSANIGSRGTSWTKELGMLVTNCPALGDDARKIFDLYWHIDGMKELPKKYPSSLSTKINVNNPVKVLNHEDGTIYKIFLSSSPPSLNADGRTDDLTAILSVIKKANKFIYIAINEYIPVALWKGKKRWPVIDDQIKEAVKKRHVEVKFLLNSRASHKSLMEKYMKELLAVDPNRIQAKYYSTDMKGILGSHNKFMVTDNSAYIGTSNWSEDYYTTTAGVAFTFEPIKKLGDQEQLDLREQLVQVFIRDYDSPMTRPMFQKDN